MFYAFNQLFQFYRKKLHCAKEKICTAEFYLITEIIFRCLILFSVSLSEYHRNRRLYTDRKTSEAEAVLF